MFKNLFSLVNWGKAVGEVLLIFIGVTIAIWFNNWNEARKAKLVEIQTLHEIKTAITQDLFDIENNIDGFSLRVNAYRIIASYIKEQKPFDEEIKKYFSHIQGYTTFLINTGPYETLKSRGLETITNDSIRLQVSTYYDVEYDRIKTNERQHHSHYLENIKPTILKNFYMEGYTIIPIDHDALMKNFEFEQTILWALRVDQYLLKKYEALSVITTQLIEQLSEEINLLQGR